MVGDKVMIAGAYYFRHLDWKSRELAVWGLLQNQGEAF